MLKVIRGNVINAMKRDGITSGNALAKIAKIDQKTVSSILSEDASPNPTLKVITALSRALRLEPWMLLVPNMPIEKTCRPRLKTMSRKGYDLLRIFEAAPEHNQASILDFAAYSLKADPRLVSEVREVRAEYGLPPKY